jgi:hypothetical protein
MAFKITKLTSLFSVTEDTVELNGEKVPRTSFATADQDENAYFGVKEGITRKELTVEIANECLQPLPDEEIYPKIPTTGVTVASDDCSRRYIKRTAWHNYPDFKDVDSTFLSRLMLQEAQTMELLSQRPHPNIEGYYGCRVKRNRIVGLVLENYSLEYDLAYAKGRPDLFKGLIDKTRIMSGIRAAVAHLHSMGLAHNDINPANIMLGEKEPKLIDFGSCQPIGKRLMSCGTPGWCKAQFFTSQIEHDEYGLELSEEWLENLVTIENS